MVDKGSADNLVSFCGRGVHKIGPTQFEVRAAQFVPTANLSVLILIPSRSETAGERQTGIDRHAQDDLYTLNCDQLWYQRNSIFKLIFDSWGRVAARKLLILLVWGTDFSKV